MYAIQCKTCKGWEVCQTWGGDVPQSDVAAIYFDKSDAWRDLADWQKASPEDEYRVVKVVDIVVRVD